MLKIKLRRDLIYLLILYIIEFFRKLALILIYNVLKFDGPYIFLFLNGFGTFIGGLTLYLYYIYSFRKKKVVNYFKLDIIHNQAILLKTQDGDLKKIILIFFAGFFDFYEFILDYSYTRLRLKSNVSIEIAQRMGCLSTIVSSLICI